MERYSIDSFILDERELAEHYKESGNEDGYKGKSKLIEFLEELKSYKKAEENGMLIHLPCRVGDTVYALTPFCEICEEALDNEYACEVCSRGNFITETKFDYELIPRFGKTVFLTRAEAEQALAKMKGEN